MSLGKGRAWFGRARALLALLVVATLAAACSTTVNVVVIADTSGQGTVAVTVTFDQATAAQVPDLQAGLPITDLKQAGWVVTGPSRGPAGSVVVSAEHPFADSAQLSTLMADLAGSGPAGGRPFQLAISTDDNLLRRDTSVTGSVDLRCQLACFDDPTLKQNVGQALGASPAEVNRLLGPDPDADVHLRFEVDLPGVIVSTDAPATTVPAAGTATLAGSGVVWQPALGQRTVISATSRVDNGAAQQAAVGAGVAAVVLAIALLALIWRRLRRRRRFGRSSGGPSGKGRWWGRGRSGGGRSRPARRSGPRRSPFRRRSHGRHGRRS